MRDMNEEYPFRILRPISEVWPAVSKALVMVFPHEHIGEMPSQYRHSVFVLGMHGYTMVTRLTYESEASTILSVYVNDRPYSKFPRIRDFREREANRIYAALMQVLDGNDAAAP